MVLLASCVVLCVCVFALTYFFQAKNEESEFESGNRDSNQEIIYKRVLPSYFVAILEYKPGLHREGAVRSIWSSVNIFRSGNKYETILGIMSFIG